MNGITKQISGIKCINDHNYCNQVNMDLITLIIGFVIVLIIPGTVDTELY